MGEYTAEWRETLTEVITEYFWPSPIRRLEETHLFPLPEVWTLWWGIGARSLTMFFDTSCLHRDDAGLSADFGLLVFHRECNRNNSSVVRNEKMN